MFALKKAKQRWEFENQQTLERVLRLAQDQTKMQAVRAARTISLLLYVFYKLSEWSLNVLRVLFVEPRLVLRIGKGKRPLERWEFEKPELNSIRRPSLF